MTGTLFLKAGGWETTRLHTKHNPGNAYWYHFGYRTRWDRFLDNADNGFPPGDNIAFIVKTSVSIIRNDIYLKYRCRSRSRDHVLVDYAIQIQRIGGNFG